MSLAQGAAAEEAAAAHLVKHGLRVLERNFRVRGGEIDLICQQGETTVFVEVRLRQNADYGGAGASITPQKQRRLILAARHWLSRHGDKPCRFDCVLMDGRSVEWIEDAFSAD